MSEFILDGQLWEAKRKIPSLGGAELLIYIMQEQGSLPTSRQLSALDAYSNQSTNPLKDIVSHAIKYYHHVAANVDLAAEGIAIDARSIANHFQVTTILVPKLGDCETDYLFLSADCDWEPEHGMQLLVENGRVVWCGAHGPLPFSAQWQRAITLPAEARRELLEELLGY